jgi:hypothetical protein
MEQPVVSRARKPAAWKKLPRQRPEHEYSEAEHRLRVLLRHELKDVRARAARDKWYANVTKDDPPDTLSHKGWVEQRRERIAQAIELRAKLRATNR